jgi:L-threonylcarbamoyladenylate synthase
MSVIIKLSAEGALPEGAAAAVSKAIKACQLVAFPTDTVYGLGSTGLVKAAWRRIYHVKGRSSLKPLPILVHSTEAAKRWVEWTPAAESLARRFWPGALTLVLRTTAEGRLLTFHEYQTIAIRVPGHAALLSLIEASGVPWATTSANLSGSPAFKDPEPMIAQFSGIADLIVDGGALAGVESTVAEATGPRALVLRQGAVSAGDIDAALKADLP